MKNILIVGAGAVGQVYGYQLSIAGNNISFFVKEKHRPKMEQGLTLYDVNKDRKRRKPIDFTNYGVETNWASAGSRIEPWEQIYFCLSTTGLNNLDFDAMKKAVSVTTTVICLQPGPEDYDLIKSNIPEEQIVQGMIVFLSYAAPFKSETVPKPGMAFLYPPLGRTPFMGPPIRRDEVVETFTRAKIKATVKEDLRDTSPYPTAAFLMLVSALEGCNWKFKELGGNKAMQRLMFGAIDDVFLALCRKAKTKPPLWRHVLGPTLLKMMIFLVPKLSPVDIEEHLKAHYTKLRAQTNIHLALYIDYAERHGVDATRISAMKHGYQ